MNYLSWILYWADIAPQLARHLQVTGILLSILGLVCLIISIFSIFDAQNAITRYSDEDNCENKLKNALKYQILAKSCRNWIILTLFCTTLIAFIGNFIPSKQTFYLIAASETGEQVIKTPEFKKIHTILNKELDRLIAGKTE